jgi:type III secretion system low calcium response chaperone LcrH/SycD
LGLTEKLTENLVRDMSTAPKASKQKGLVFENEEEVKDFLVKFGRNGRTFRDCTALTPENMEAFYFVAYNQYNAGQFEEAEKVFRLLAVLDHFQVKYWKGLAASLENQRKYKDAVRAWGFLALLDMQDPEPPFMAARCFLAVGQTEEAKSGLQIAIANTEGKPDPLGIKDQAEQMLSALEKQSQPGRNGGTDGNGSTTGNGARA